MLVTEDVHAIKIPFKLSVGSGRTLDRFVFAYLILGEEICLIDCGVAHSADILFSYIMKTGRSPDEISSLVFTHSHPDHIGGARTIVQETGCKVFAHEDARPWIEDVELQSKQRPILNFHELVEGSVEVGLSLKDGDRLELGKGRHLKVFHTPGHSRGSIALFFDKDGILFSGDAIPVPRSVPIYEDVMSSIRSIRKLMAINGIESLLASWEEPHHGSRVYDIMKDGLGYLQEIQTLVLEEHARLPLPELPELGSRVLRRLGLPETALMPMVMKSFEAHLRVSEYQDLSRI